MTTDAILSFVSAMDAAGMKPIESIADRLGNGALVRFRCQGDAPGRRNGWAVLHLDGRPAGAFGNYRMSITERWRADGQDRVSPAERRELAKQYRAQRQEREAALQIQQRAAAERCRGEWERAGDCNPAHPYLVRKGITGEGCRQSGHWLLVPMQGPDGNLWNLQRIAPDGTKRFAKGAMQAGLFLVLGSPAGTICIAEGYATGATIRRAAGHAVAVAFSAVNLKATAITVDALFPNSEIIVCADDDAHLVANPCIARNIGVEAAQDAARAVGGRVAMPPRKEIA